MPQSPYETHMRAQLERMINPRKWPNKPFMPLVRKWPGKPVEVGFLYWRGPGNLLMPCVYFGTTPSLTRDVDSYTSYTYPTWSSLLNDGWAVVVE